MKKLVILSLALVALSACCKQQTFDYTVDKFYDLEILRYQVPEFDSLSLQQKTLVYHLTEAALHGRDILFDQNGRYNLRIRRALEALYTQYKGDKTSAEFINFEKYLKRVWFANGIHHHYASDKFQPEFSQDWFVAACAEAGVTYDEAILPVIFDPTVMPKSLSLEGEDLLNKAKELGAVQCKAIATENIHLLTDYLVATTSLTNQETQGFGSITIDTDLKSPTLGAVTIQLKHTRALLRLPKSAANIEEGTYIVNGTAHNVTGLGTLWAKVQYGSSTYYYPLTEVGDYLQAIVVADLPDQMPGNATLTGFKAVMLTEESGIVGSDSFDETKTLTLDLPFKKGASTTVSTSIYLLPNYRYPLTLNIAPHTASVTLTSPLGKPGWGTDEEELSNLLNEPITVDGTQYIKLDGTATDMDKVKSIIETAIAVGYTNFYVTGKTLAAYSNGTAKTVVGEAIRQLAEEPTVSLLLPEATEIGENAFYDCTALTSVSAPKATTIGNEAFDGCSALTSVSLPEAETIGNKAFRYCSALTSVELPAATSIGYYAFSSCTSLTRVSLPAATSIGESAFYECIALKSVSLPAATSIRLYAFKGCTALTSLSFGTVITRVSTDVFDGTPTENCDLTLNSGQQSSTYPVGTDDNGKPTWAGKTWASISYVDDDGNAVESN